MKSLIGKKVLEISLEKSGFDLINSIMAELSNFTNGSFCFLGILKDRKSDTVLGILANEGDVLEDSWEYCMTDQPCRLVYDNHVLNIPCDVQSNFPRKKDSGSESFLGFPLSHPSKGIIAHFASYSNFREEFSEISEDCIKLIQLVLSREISLLLENFSITEMEEEVSIWKRAALTDSLTLCSNRRALESDWAKSGQAGSTFGSISILDIDFFKKINDNYGHEIGDQCLKFFSEIFTQNCADEKIKFYRLGGEEFCLFAPFCNPEELKMLVTNVANKLSTLLESQSRIPSFTFSGGIAGYTSSDLRKALSDADASLYAAKQSGRNKILISPKVT